MAHVGGPLPSLPAKIKIPTFKVTSTFSGDIEIPSAIPFYYAGIQTVWVYWQVDLPLLQAYLDPLGMSPAHFGGAGLVGINFFNAVALYGAGQPGNPGVAGFNETELNIMAYPTAVARNVPQNLTVEQFLTDGDQTKRIGAYRVWVACDDAVAVAAGQQLFFENKFLTDYTYDVPALNNPGQSTFTWTCHDPKDVTLAIYQATVNLAGLSPVPGNMSEWIDLSYVTDAKRVAGSRRNYFGMYDTYLLPSSGTNAVSVTTGESTHPMKHDMERLIGTRPAVAVQLFRSPTCIAEARPYWADE
jgi:hypothetical protein